MEMVTPPHTPVPFSAALEDLYIPDAQRIVNAVKTRDRVDAMTDDQING